MRFAYEVTCFDLSKNICIKHIIDDVCFVLEKYAELDFDSVSSLKQQSTASDVGFL